MAKLTKITMIVFILYIVLGLTSCVTKKKLKESQELQSTFILDQTETKWTNSVQNIKEELSTSILSKFNETIKSFKESTTTNENETTDISVTIKAEEGKEKSATVGNTTVTSNGADITVKTSSTKSLSKESEVLISVMSKTINQLETSLKMFKIESEQRDYTNLKRIEKLESQLEKSSKETNKKGLSFWVIIIALILALLFVAIKYFKVKIPFLG